MVGGLKIPKRNRLRNLLQLLYVGWRWVDEERSGEP
jgi:hypothetical protein